MKPRAYVVHQLRSRVRLRIKAKRNDYPYFEGVRRELDLLPGVDEVRINPTTGTILLVHPEQPFEQLLSRLQRSELFECMECAEPQDSALAPVSNGLSMIDKALFDSSEGRLDLRALTYIGLMVVTLLQIRRGNLLGPALPFLWQAFSLLGRIDAWHDALTDQDDGDPTGF